LVSQNYLLGNAFAGVALPREQARPLGSRRTLTFGQWDALEERLDEFAGDPVGRRRARAIRWLYATGLRLAEMADAHCGDLQQVDYRLPNGSEDSGWMLSVVGKGDKLRQVPVPSRLVEELQDELEQNGLEADVRHESNRDVAILMRLEAGVARPWSASGLAKGIKDVLERCARPWTRMTPSSYARQAPTGSGTPTVRMLLTVARAARVCRSRSFRTISATPRSARRRAI
jgi:integrase